MKHRINSAVSQQGLYPCGVAPNLRVDADDLEEGLESAAEDFTDEALAAGYYCSHFDGALLVKES
jgi:hypothetical protein